MHPTAQNVTQLRAGRCEVVVENVMIGQGSVLQLHVHAADARRDIRLAIATRLHTRHQFLQRGRLDKDEHGVGGIDKLQAGSAEHIEVGDEAQPGPEAAFDGCARHAVIAVRMHFLPFQQRVVGDQPTEVLQGDEMVLAGFLLPRAR